ncbi:MAG: hypothetical protein JW821_11345 [Deltaproteobacteria bacterium]|nr:hypothetical protein [Deltaproteobacteria bacterium]
MFGKKKRGFESSAPFDVPSFVSRQIGNNWGKLPAAGGHWVHYKIVSRPSPEGGEVFDVRIFDEGQAIQEKVRIADYASLDLHPEMVLMEGRIDRKSGMADIRPKKAA